MMEKATVINKKNTGSYYTCTSVADYIADWAIDNPNLTVLEPSFGSGVFIDSAIKKFAKLGNKSPSITGIEKQKIPYENYTQNHSINGFLADFMDFKAEEKINAVIGNPPYVSLKNVTDSERKSAHNLVRTFGVNMNSSASLWMPFMIYSTELLCADGKLGFVLPYEITYVRYAFELWDYLSKNFGKITLCRIYRDFFPEVEVETVIFLAEKKGERTDSVFYKVFETLEDLYSDKPLKNSTIRIKAITSMEKPFEVALLKNSTEALLNILKSENKIEKSVEACKFKIGYVSGSKEFFNISADELQKFKICRENSKKSLLNAKQINFNKESGIETARISNFSYLFYPQNIGENERKYIEYGEKLKINDGYKCRKRSPWYIVPQIEKPDLVLTVFGNVPKLLLNDGEFYISNSLLGGTLNSEDGKEFICRWYNSLTLLSIETMVHSLGGGSLVLIPGETDNIEIISGFPKNQVEQVFQKLSEFAKKNSTEDVYRYGDEIVLKDLYGFTDTQINSVRDSISELRNWRLPENRRENSKRIKKIPAIVSGNEFVKEIVNA